MSGPNVDLLCRTLAHIEANPREWDQRDWRAVDPGPRCGTAACFAGWAALLNGSKWDVPAEHVGDYDDTADILMAVDGGVPVGWAAQRALGLTVEQADELFAGGNSLGDLRIIVAEICATAEVGAR